MAWYRQSDAGTSSVSFALLILLTVVRYDYINLIKTFPITAGVSPLYTEYITLQFPSPGVSTPTEVDRRGALYWWIDICKILQLEHLTAAFNNQLGFF